MRLKISDKKKKLLRKAIIGDICFGIGFKIGFEQGFKEGFKIGFERGIAIGEERGEERGIIKGEIKKALEIAKKMLTMGMNALDISQIVGLSVDEINALAK